MNDDLHFQEVRLRNVVTALGWRSRRSDAERVVLASVLVDHDPQTAALIAARLLQAILDDLSRRTGIPPQPRKGETKAGSLARRLDGRPEVVQLGVRPGLLPSLWRLRRTAIHGTPTRAQAKTLVRKVRELRSHLAGRPE
jgi:hypothetical protein